MNLVEEYKGHTNFKTVEDMFKSLSSVFMFGSIESQYKSEKTIKIKEDINDLTIQFLENILSNNLANTKQEKITVMSLLDELNYRNEILHLMEKEKQAELQKAAETIGEKFASSDL